MFAVPFNTHSDVHVFVNWTDSVLFLFFFSKFLFSKLYVQLEGVHINNITVTVKHECFKTKGPR